jgi:formylglycine-generating enzyme required for sulfatase activity/serine/threonine protein kinase
MPLSPGQILHNRYRIVILLGQGGFGAVYKAWDMRLKVACALKENFDPSPAAARQFEREATLLARLRHPALPKVTDHFSLPGRGQYLVMEYIEGQDLQERLEKAGGPLPETQVLPWIEQVLEALVYLHSQNPPVVHRDIKPANIYITPSGQSPSTGSGQAMLVDFGLAKAYDPNLKTTRGARAVTPGFSPYEQYGKGTTDVRSDLYALGATLYTLLTGQEPPESIQRVVHDPLVPPQQLSPDLSPQIAVAVEKSLNMDPEQRFQNAAEFLAALRSAPQVRPAAPQTFTPKTPTLKGIISPSGLWHWAGIAGAILLVALLILAVAQRSRRLGDGRTPTRTALMGGLALPSTPTMLSTLASPTPGLAPSITPTQLPIPTPLVYSVKKGDTCSEIAQAFGMTVQGLADLNHLAPDCGVIMVGQKLLIQATNPSPGFTLLPTVSPEPRLSVTTQVAELDHMEMVYVPAGPFLMGSADSDPEAESDEKPQHWVYLDAFWIDRTEVSNALYARCAQAQACRPPAKSSSKTRLFYYDDSRYSNYPVIYVSWDDAKAYCQWARRRLPSEAEWEKAASWAGELKRNTGSAAMPVRVEELKRKYPWGNENPSLDYLNFDNRIGDTTPAGSFPQGASPFGVLDMAGNVSEWVADRYDASYYSISPAFNPFGPASGNFHVLRGGSWYNIARVVRAAFRFWNYPDAGYETSGFRCAK